MRERIDPDLKVMIILVGMLLLTMLGGISIDAYFQMRGQAIIAAKCECGR